MSRILLLLALLLSSYGSYAQNAPKPCTTDSRYREFDFWAGEWDVKNPKGQRVGYNHVEIILDSCVVMENWHGSQGGSGKSFNYIDTGDGKWHQLWVSSQGISREFSGYYENDKMALEGKFITQNGQQVLTKLTFFKLSNNKVRQLGEQSYDLGKTWNTMYDLTYERK